MKEDVFISKNEAVWNQLESFYKRLCHSSVKDFSQSEIRELVNLFRKASHHLAYARTYFPNSSIVPYLNGLISKCHPKIYINPEPPLISKLKTSFLKYPYQLKSLNKLILLSFCTFLGGFLVALLTIFIEPSLASIFLNQSIIDNLSSSGIPLYRDWDYPLISSVIMTNNISVSILCFIWGITFGVGTFYLLFYNGLNLGALTAVVYLYADPTTYWSLILPHGIIEITAIIISGAAGFCIARGMLLLQNMRFKDSLAKHGKLSINLMGGVVIMLIIAAIIEGFITPLNIHIVLKYSVAGLSALLLIIYFILPYIGTPNDSEIKEP